MLICLLGWDIIEMLSFKKNNVFPSGEIIMDQKIKHERYCNSNIYCKLQNNGV
ncbi:hypothetical protein J14TS2_30770 [Bacillus sp. J14TS2]|nr:hypothetical protein J14TS2_30770 [Bacillus sp. J14TS2]